MSDLFDEPERSDLFPDDDHDWNAPRRLTDEEMVWAMQNDPSLKDTEWRRTEDSLLRWMVTHREQVPLVDEGPPRDKDMEDVHDIVGFVRAIDRDRQAGIDIGNPAYPGPAGYENCWPPAPVVTLSDQTVTPPISAEIAKSRLYRPPRWNTLDEDS